MADTFGDRRGVTFIELLLVVVVGLMVVSAIFQVLVTNQRVFSAQSAHMRQQQVLRAGMDVLFGELREISPSDGDLVSMGDHSLTIRSSRSLGLVCSIAVGGTDPTVQARVVGAHLTGDSARVFYENSPFREGDDVWRTAHLTIIDTTDLLSCPTGETAQEIVLNGVEFGSRADTDSITPGALVRNFRHNVYGLGTYDGEPYLIRTDEDGVESPLVGPVRAGDGVEFRYLDTDGIVTAAANDVRQIEITIRTSGGHVDADGSVLEDSIQVRIYTRNAN